MLKTGQKTDGRSQVFLLTHDHQTRGQVEAAVGADGDSSSAVIQIRSLELMEAQLSDADPSVVLVDIDPDPMQFLRRLERLTQATGNHRLVLLCSQPGQELILEAMQVGARHCMAKHSIPAELGNVMARLSRGFGQTTLSDKVVTVLSASGGCGSSIIAINMAEEFRHGQAEPSSLLVDLDTGYGGIAAFFGLKGRYGVADLIQAEGDVDPQLVRSTATKCPDGLQVLLSPASTDFGRPSPLDYNKVVSLVPACRQAYATTVIDAPRIPMPAAAGLANESSLTLIVFELTVIGLNTARAIASSLVQSGVTRDQILMVINRHERRSRMLDMRDAREALGNLTVTSVSNDFKSAMRSMNLGQPLSRAAPRSRIRRDVRGLVEAVKAGTMPRMGKDQKKSWQTNSTNGVPKVG